MKKIQQYTADIRRETSMLTTAHSYAGGQKKKVQEAAQAAKATMLEARRLLEGFPTGGGGSVSEQNHRRLTQQKLTENLMGASKALEAAFRAYEVAEVERQRRDAAEAAAASSGRGSGVAGVEMGAMDASPSAVEAGRLGQQQVQDMDVGEAEADVHTAIVEEYVQEISQISNSISVLQKAMVDLAEHAQAQGTTLDVIEANMSSAIQSTDGATEQLTHASRNHRTGTKLIFWLLLLAVIIVVALIVIVARKH